MWLRLIKISRYTVTFQFSFKTKISNLSQRKFKNYLKNLKIDPFEMIPLDYELI